LQYAALKYNFVLINSMRILLVILILLGAMYVIHDAGAVTAMVDTNMDKISLGQDLTIRIAEPDANFDSRTVDRIPLDVIFISTDKFDEEPLDRVLAKTGIHASQQSLMETGYNTGMFEVTLESINSSLVDRGEDIRIIYIDSTPSGSGSPVRVETIVHVVTANISVYFDRQEYSPSDVIKVTVVAPMFNINRNKADVLNTASSSEVAVTVQSGQTYYPLLFETGVGTGIFVGKIKIGSEGSGSDLIVRSGDSVRVTVVIAPGFSVSDSAMITAKLGSVSFNKSEYSAGESVILTVADIDENKDPDSIDSVNARVWSGTDVDGMTLALQESSASSGVFEGRFMLGTGSDGTLQVSVQDMVFAKYTDTTLPSLEHEKETFASAIIGSLKNDILISNPSVLDQNGTAVHGVSAGDLVIVQSSVTNARAEGQKFVYIIHVMDDDGFTANISIVNGMLEPFQSFKVGRSWIPDASGKYLIEVFAWRSIEQPFPLSTVRNIAITVE
jgi:hypothetical protein